MGAEVLSRYQIIVHTNNHVWNESIEESVVRIIGDWQIQLLNRLGQSIPKFLSERIGI